MNEQLQQEEPQQLDRKDVKILAYRQRVSEQDEQIADLRVEVTFLAQQLQDTVERLAKYEQDEEGAEESDVPQDKD